MVVMPDGMECNTKESIEQACLQENQSCFNQASETPLLQPPLYGLLGPLGTGTAAAAILAGNFQYPEHPEIQNMLNALQLYSIVIWNLPLAPCKSQLMITNVGVMCGVFVGYGSVVLKLLPLLPCCPPFGDVFAGLFDP